MWLTREARPQFTEQEAIEKWEQYRSRIDSLKPEPLCQKLPLSNADQQHRKVFLQETANRGDLLDLIKIDPMCLPIHQLRVIVPRYETYGPKVKTRNGWITTALPTNPPAPQITMNYVQGGTMTEVIYELPHGEFVFPFIPQMHLNGFATGGFMIQQGNRTVEVTTDGKRYLLWAGYHRSLARLVSNIGDGNERAALMAVTRADFLATPNQAPEMEAKRLLCLRERPPLLKDFLDDDLCMTLNLQKQRFIYRVKGNIEALEDTT